MDSHLVSEILFKHVTGSTNDDAIRLARAGAPEGTLILADYQTDGRGRFGRRWVAAPKTSVLMSLILRPAIPMERMGLLNLAASVSVAMAISKEIGMDATIKWPNDVLVKRRKVAGILLETGLDLNGNPFSALGIGINVNVPADDFPLDLRSKATSLSELAGRYLDRFELIDLFLSEFEPRYREINSGEWSALLSEYRRLSWTLGKWVRLTVDGHRIDGLALDIGDHGELLVRLPDGRFERAFSGESSMDY
ncbi:TPA: biotin--[acetyl-CoA-carboxylase] ligase [Candidatus Poribacteria bacterium]|nr:biotin--[acetyl-CoA-carboxylase] ligase [Candidatus Poribacteria bacterium]